MSIPFLWEHQGKVLEGYEAHTEAKDIALELPTGTGKTLIGLLIAEWRRRANEERVLYLCPTRQLVHQVGALAPAYGIDARVCLAPDYDDLDEWNAGRTVAVSTYSALFNYRPKFDVPDALILDDAHAAEDYVASHWTVTIDREEMPSAYARFAQIIDPLLERRTAGVLTDDAAAPRDRGSVELIPLPRWWPYVDAVIELLDEVVESTEQYFAWADFVRDGIAACSLLVSWNEIVLRPLIPATKHHEPFRRAAQRIYMSATLGAGGELERIFGVRSIERLPVPEEWERHSTGRRLFLLPGASLRPREMETLVVEAIRRVGRALVLTPRHTAVDERRAALEEAEIPTLTASDIEESLDPFTSHESAALVLANRYDGLDLPGDDCRLLVLDGLPVAVNALEQFLYSRLAATGLLRERMRTRLTQGVGRCSRGEGDWCAVLVASREGYDFCARRELRELLHPELQGELRFGLEQSRDRELADFLHLLDLLLDRGDDWADAEAQIRQLRDEAIRRSDPATAQLEAAVADEVGFVYAMWNGDYPRALEHAVAVTDELSGDEAAAYRAWWLYHAGCAAWLAHDAFGTEAMLPRARDLFGRAAGTGRAVSWFAELAYGELGEAAELEVDRDDLAAIERVHMRLGRIGFHGTGFGRRAHRLRERLDATDEPSQYEEGLTQLGRLLGWDAEHPGGTNVPDSVWIASDRLALAWEAKSDEAPKGEIGARTVQQASGHAAWIRDNRTLSEEAVVLPLLVSHRTKLADGASSHVDDVRLVGLDVIRSLAEDMISVLARVRARAESADDTAVRSLLVEEFAQAALLPSQLADRLAESALADLI